MVTLYLATFVGEECRSVVQTNNFLLSMMNACVGLDIQELVQLANIDAEQTKNGIVKLVNVFPTIQE